MVLNTVLCRPEPQILTGVGIQHQPQKPTGASTIYQQQLRYIQNNGLDILPARLFVVDFIAQLQTWQQQDNYLLIVIEMNKHVLRGHLAKYMVKMGLIEVTHHGWGNVCVCVLDHR